MTSHEESAPGVLRQHVEKNGLKVIRGKGSKTQVISWTPRLLEAVDRALKLPSTIGTMQVIHDRKGQKIGTTRSVSRGRRRWRRP